MTDNNRLLVGLCYFLGGYLAGQLFIAFIRWVAG